MEGILAKRNAQIYNAIVWKYLHQCTWLRDLNFKSWNREVFDF